jgi:4-hydroxybenzoate polyprenyltransferase
MAALSTLFAALILIAGLLIPAYIIARMYRVLQDRPRERADRLFAGGAIIAMCFLMALSIYAAGETHRVLNAIAQVDSAT